MSSTLGIRIFSGGATSRVTTAVQPVDGQLISFELASGAILSRLQNTVDCSNAHQP